MKTLPLAEVKNNLSKLVDRVETLRKEIMITRNGRPAAVMVSFEEYHAWKETLAIRWDEASWLRSEEVSRPSRRNQSSITR